MESLVLDRASDLHEDTRARLGLWKPSHGLKDRGADVPWRPCCADERDRQPKQIAAASTYAINAGNIRPLTAKPADHCER